jgi:mannitol/fructose-specific phosphotransferase system IIA component (Ntr-type)
MNLKKILSEDLVILHLQGITKPEIIGEMLDALCAAGRVRNRERAWQALMEREAKMSTGMQSGLALPHAKTDETDRLVAAIGLKREGVPFDSLDGQPSTIFVMTLSPLNRAGPHIQFLAEIGRLIHDASVRQRLLAAQTPQDALKALAG